MAETLSDEDDAYAQRPPAPRNWRKQVARILQWLFISIILAGGIILFGRYLSRTGILTPEWADRFDVLLEYFGLGAVACSILRYAIYPKLVIK